MFKFDKEMGDVIGLIMTVHLHSGGELLEDGLKIIVLWNVGDLNPPELLWLFDPDGCGCSCLKSDGLFVLVFGTGFLYIGPSNLFACVLCSCRWGKSLCSLLRIICLRFSSLSVEG